MTRLVARCLDRGLGLGLGLGLGAAVALVACAGSPAKPATAAAPAAAAPVEAPLAVAGARCTGGACRCRAVDNYGRSADSPDEGPVAEGHKRFELRTGRGTDAIRVTVEGRGTLVKAGELPDPACGYIDLAPGRYRVRVRVAARAREEGIQPRLVISEYGAGTRDWYDSFAFRCGGEVDACTKGEMEQWLGEARRRQRGIYDACGSARVEGLRWGVEHSPEQRLEDLDLELTLVVYKFAPRFPHGTPSCKGLHGGRAAEEELAGQHD